MTNKQLIAEIRRAIERREEQEQRLCDEYIKLNPQDKKRRNRDKQLIDYAFMLIRLDVEQIERSIEK